MLYFLAGIPRSGSTLLASLLSQRPDTFVSATSGLCDIMGAAVTTWEQNPANQASGDGDGKRLLQAVAQAHYEDKTEPIIIDKSRSWADPSIIESMRRVQGDVKIIATVRPIRDCLASFVKIAKPDNVKLFCRQAPLARHLFGSYQALKAGFDAHPECFHFVEYDNLVKNPQEELRKVAEFLGLEQFEHSTVDLKPVQEDDDVWGIKNLHKVRKTVTKRRFSRRKLLGDELWDFYSGGSFWTEDKPKKKKQTPLNKQYELLMAGDFDGAKALAFQNLELYPGDNNIAFNAGWFMLSDGKIQEGYNLLDRGRDETVWGDPHIGSSQPIWNGQRGATVLLRLERGLGDQFHQVRYARYIAAMECTVIVSCSPELAHVVRHARGVSAVVEHEAALGVLHDFWFPAMSFPGMLPTAISGDPYISLPPVDVIPGRVGLRWSGNPLYEHATKRLFPTEPFFEMAQNTGKTHISLQKGEGEDLAPGWVEKVPLDTWVDTAMAMASCELIITSCTSIAHLAGAMGIPTQIIVPVVPYYLWALPGSTTPYYDSVTLLRQTTPDDWDSVFKPWEVMATEAMEAEAMNDEA